MKAEKYQILIQGLIDESWAAYFGGMTVTAESNGVTSLSGEIADQSALHGLLNQIRDLNIVLISVQLLDSDGATPVECRRCPNFKEEIHEFTKRDRPGKIGNRSKRK